MSKTSLRPISTYLCKDANGDLHWMVKYTLDQQGHTSEGHYSTEGPVDLRTRDGRYVDWIEKGHYQVIEGPDVWTNDPDP
jgi:hypothetical protein